MKMVNYKILVIIFLFLSVESFSQDKSLLGDSTNIVVKEKVDTVFHDAEQIETDNGMYYFLNQKEFWLSITILALLLIILLIEAMMIKNRKFNDEAAIRLIIVTIVIIGTLFLFVSGYSDKQIAPAFGLFGTICGYLFGKSANTKDKTES